MALTELQSIFKILNLENNSINNDILMKLRKNLDLLMSGNEINKLDEKSLHVLLPELFLLSSSKNKDLRLAFSDYFSCFKQVIKDFNHNGINIDWLHLMNQEFVQRFTHNLMSIVETGSEDWIEPWLLVIETMFSEDRMISGSVINILLKVAEKSFKLGKQKPKRLEIIFLTWKRFIDIFSGSKKVLNSKKILSLFVIPLMSSMPESGDVYKLETWEHLVNTIGFQSAMAADIIVNQFLTFLLSQRIFSTFSHKIPDYISSVAKNPFVLNKCFPNIISLINLCMKHKENDELICNAWRTLLESSEKEGVIEKNFELISSVLNLEIDTRTNLKIDMCLIAMEQNFFNFLSTDFRICSFIMNIFPSLINELEFRSKVFTSFLSCIQEAVSTKDKSSEEGKKSVMCWKSVSEIYQTFLQQFEEDQFSPSPCDLQIISLLFTIPLSFSSQMWGEGKVQRMLSDLVKTSRCDVVLTKELMGTMVDGVKNSHFDSGSCLKLATILPHKDFADIVSLLSVVSKEIVGSDSQSVVDFLSLLDSATCKGTFDTAGCFKVSFKAPLNCLLKISPSYQPPYDFKVKALASKLLRRLSALEKDVKATSINNETDDKKNNLRSPLMAHSNFLHRLTKAESRKTSKILSMASIFPSVNGEENGDLTVSNKENKEENDISSPVSSKQNKRIANSVDTLVEKSSPNKEELERFGKPNGYQSDESTQQTPIRGVRVTTDLHKKVTVPREDAAKDLTEVTPPRPFASVASPKSSPNLILALSPNVPKSPALATAQNSRKTASYFEDSFDSEEFVFVAPKQKDRPLTEHQKEVLKQRREDIPALYQDLSQDTQSLDHSSDDSLLVLKVNEEKNTGNNSEVSLSVEDEGKKTTEVTSTIKLDNEVEAQAKKPEVEKDSQVLPKNKSEEEAEIQVSSTEELESKKENQVLPAGKLETKTQKVPVDKSQTESEKEVPKVKKLDSAIDTQLSNIEKPETEAISQISSAKESGKRTETTIFTDLKNDERNENISCQESIELNGNLIDHNIEMKSLAIKRLNFDGVCKYRVIELSPESKKITEDMNIRRSGRKSTSIYKKPIKSEDDNPPLENQVVPKKRGRSKLSPAQLNYNSSINEHKDIKCLPGDTKDFSNSMKKEYIKGKNSSNILGESSKLTSNENVLERDQLPKSKMTDVFMVSSEILEKDVKESNLKKFKKNKKSLTFNGNSSNNEESSVSLVTNSKCEVKEIMTSEESKSKTDIQNNNEEINVKMTEHLSVMKEVKGEICKKDYPPVASNSDIKLTQDEKCDVSLDNTSFSTPLTEKGHRRKRSKETIKHNEFSPKALRKRLSLSSSPKRSKKLEEGSKCHNRTAEQTDSSQILLEVPNLIPSQVNIQNSTEQEKFNNQHSIKILSETNDPTAENKAVCSPLLHIETVENSIKTVPEEEFKIIRRKKRKITLSPAADTAKKSKLIQKQSPEDDKSKLKKPLNLVQWLKTGIKKLSPCQDKDGLDKGESPSSQSGDGMSQDKETNLEKIEIIPDSQSLDDSEEVIENSQESAYSPLLDSMKRRCDPPPQQPVITISEVDVADHQVSPGPDTSAMLPSTTSPDKGLKPSSPISRRTRRMRNNRAGECIILPSSPSNRSEQKRKIKQPPQPITSYNNKNWPSGEREEWIAFCPTPPQASPSVTILKKTMHIQSPNTSPKTTPKKKVSFVDPPVTKGLLYSKETSGGEVQHAATGESSAKKMKLKESNDEMDVKLLVSEEGEVSWNITSEVDEAASCTNRHNEQAAEVAGKLIEIEHDREGRKDDSLAGIEELMVEEKQVMVAEGKLEVEEGVQTLVAIEEEETTGVITGKEETEATGCLVDAEHVEQREPHSLDPITAVLGKEEEGCTAVVGNLDIVLSASNSLSILNQKEEELTDQSHSGTVAATVPCTISAESKSTQDTEVKREDSEDSDIVASEDKQKYICQVNRVLASLQNISLRKPGLLNIKYIQALREIETLSRDFQWKYLSENLKQKQSEV